MLVPHTTYKSHGASGQELESSYIYVKDLDDIFWTVSDDELRQIFNQSLNMLITDEEKEEAGG